MMFSSLLSFRRAVPFFLSALFFLIPFRPASAQETADIVPDPESLLVPFGPGDEEAFRSPAKVYYPETWFHFIGGNVSREGIDADLEAIAGAGISGVQWFHGYFGGPWPETGPQLKTMTPEWEEMVGYLGRKAESLGLRLTIQTCPGWSMAGGPWIEPENAMRMLVWSRTDVPAGERPVDPLPLPKPSDESWRDYRDIRVLAFPTPLGDTGKPLEPAVNSAPDDAWKALIEGKAKKTLSLEAGSSVSITFTLPSGSVIRTLQLPPIGSFSHNWCYDPGIHLRLTASAPGGEKVLLDAPLPMSNWQDRGNTHGLELACNEVGDAESYTFTLTNVHPAAVKFIRFLSAARKNCWQGEAGWSLIAKESAQEHTDQNPLAFIRSGDILDLTDRMDATGRLDWTAPEGKLPEGGWTILRVGHVNAGRKNNPAPPEATGWECSKFDPRGAEIQFANYVGMLQDGPLGGRAAGMLMDSWECMTQTWTASMEEDFRKTVGYSLAERLPALMGYVIDSQEETSRFLIDWRRTANRLYCENFFKKMTDLAHSKGMDVQYETAGGDVVTMDPLEFFKYADIPMCEFWQPFSEGYVGDLDFKPVRPTVSAAHLYGKPRVAAESFTSFSLTWDEHWQMLKEVANFNMAEGVTHNVFHTYTHNPQIGFLPPGTSFARNIGTPFLRGQTWWKYMPWFTSYLARTGYLLERGRPVVTVLWYLGDEIGHKPFQYTGNGKRRSGKIRFPEGFKYDYCNPDALLTRLRVEDGRIVTPEGIAYEVLWIPENERMLPETIEKIGELARAGARVIAEAPLSPATLEEGAAERFEKAVSSVWGGIRKGRINRLGKGNLAVGVGLDEALKAFGLKPHLKDGGAGIIWSERHIDGARWYYIAAPTGEGFKGKVRLEGKGRAEWWNPVDGSVRSLKARGIGRLKRVFLDLQQAESGFVVFRENPAGTVSRKPAFPQHLPVAPVGNDGWKVRFPGGWGVPEEPVSLVELKPWKDLDVSEEGKAFSGTAIYETTFMVDKDLIGKELLLDLGAVDMIAEVTVNGKNAGVCWTAPYILPVGDLVQEGENRLSVAVTGTWYNRLAYDASLPEAERKTWTIAGPAAGSPLHDSGLLGPVRLLLDKLK